MKGWGRGRKHRGDEGREFKVLHSQQLAKIKVSPGNMILLLTGLFVQNKTHHFK